MSSRDEFLIDGLTIQQRRAIAEREQAEADAQQAIEQRTRTGDYSETNIPAPFGGNPVSPSTAPPPSSPSKTPAAPATKTAPSGTGSSVSTGGSASGVASGSASPTLKLSILSGAEMKWYFDSSTGKYYVGYGLPGSSREAIFEAEPDQMDSLFGRGVRPSAETVRFTELLRRSHVTFSGNIAEMEGTGSFEAEVAKVVALAMDEGVLPDWASSSPAVMDIIYLAQAEGKSTSWVVDQIAKLPEFEQRFPGLKALQGELGGSTEAAVAAFLELEKGIKTLETQFGGSASSVTPSTVGSLLSSGYTLTDVQRSYEAFDRFKKHAPALQGFNEVLVGAGMQALTEDQMFEFLAGRAPREIYDVYEAASFRTGANELGLGEYLDPRYAMQLAYQTPGVVDDASIQRQLRQAATSILRMRSDLDLDRYGLDHEDLIDLSLGMRPRSGATLADVEENVVRVMQEGQAFIEMRKRPFYGFSQTGQPQAASLTTRPTR